MKRISIGSWAYTTGPHKDSPIDWDTVTTRLAELGFDGVELAAFGPHPNPEQMASPVSREEVLGKLQVKKLGLSGIVPDLWNQKLANTSNHDAYIAAFTRYCDFAKSLGIKTIRVDTIQPPEILADYSLTAVIERVSSAWRHCTKIAAERGLMMSWEFEPGFVLNAPSDIIEVLERVDALNFGILYDTCHAQVVSVVGPRQFNRHQTLPGGQGALIKMLAGRINHIYLMDSDNTLHKDASGRPETSNRVPFGKGVIDFDRVIPMLQEYAPLADDWWTIDLFNSPDVWPMTEQSKRAVDEFNRKYH